MAKLLFLTDILNLGGVSSFITTLANGLQGRGHDVTVIVNKPNGVMERELAPGVRLEYLRPRNWHTRALLTAVLSRKIRKEGYHAVIFNNCYYVDSYCLRDTEIKGLFVIHGNSPLELNRFLKEGLYCRDIITISPAVHARFEHLSRSGYKVSLVPHGTIVPEKVMPRPFSPFRIVFLGRISAEKGAGMLAPVMLPLLNRHPDMVLTIVGNNEQDPAYQQHIIQELREGLHNPAQLILETGLSGGAATLQLTDAHILLGPSKTEAFGLAFIEGAAYGAVPVISRLKQVTDHLFEQGRNAFLAEPDDTGAFRDAIEYLYTNRDAWHRMSALGHQHVFNNYQVQKMIAAYEQLIAADRTVRQIVRRNLKQRLFAIYRQMLFLNIRLMIAAR